MIISKMRLKSLSETGTVGFPAYKSIEKKNLSVFLYSVPYCYKHKDFARLNILTTGYSNSTVKRVALNCAILFHMIKTVFASGLLTDIFLLRDHNTEFLFKCSYSHVVFVGLLLSLVTFPATEFCLLAGLDERTAVTSSRTPATSLDGPGSKVGGGDGTSISPPFQALVLGTGSDSESESVSRNRGF